MTGDETLTPAALAALDFYFPPRGPCGMCGGHDARHRLLNAIGSRYRAGDTIPLLANDYNLPEAAVRLAVDLETVFDPKDSDA